jgi:hypothetical protein
MENSLVLSLVYAERSGPKMVYSTLMSHACCLLIAALFRDRSDDQAALNSHIDSECSSSRQVWRSYHVCRGVASMADTVGPYSDCCTGGDHLQKTIEEHVDET